MNMILTAHSILLMLAMLFVNGCAITHETSVVVGNTREPTNPSEIKLYTKPPAKYEEIAIISADSAHDFMNKQKLMDIAIFKLKEEAAKVGANGILLEGVGDFYIGSSGIIVAPNATGSTAVVGTTAMNARTGKKASGMAIFVIEE